jgi:DNA-binding CsgD family transcriptional regulator
LRGAEALTPSERRIAEMAAEGMSNPEIAQALFITRNTVQTHMRHVFEKLAVRSREELPAKLEARV